ncbi:tetratricopeptide repeat protein [candidate division CSSED10-310 bacterium]|uniref:Tetratricopeptide repeat protein n=1 Tax=candidate division CSSED10-310 bacterium TaxID=2855610 RepID=A0ABV6YYG8_UNCC1
MDTSSSTIGPYLILSPLGRGGMGVVHRARHLKSGETVALKTILVTHAGKLQSIRREIHTLIRTKHPGIVRFIANGVHEGIPWYAMELLAGVTLGQYCFKLRVDADQIDYISEQSDNTKSKKIGLETASDCWWTETLEKVENFSLNEDQIHSHKNGQRVVSIESRAQYRQISPEQLEHILLLMSRLCFPLAFLHGAGIVHRDLKPENVIVKPDGTPVLVDFGLMTQYTEGSSREVLLVDRSCMGTILYMAPEQIKGEIVDSRADLYSLGCILYELLTGLPPFFGDSIQEIIYSHLHDLPLKPSHITAGIPQELDELIDILLTKNPRERLGYADSLATALVSLAGKDCLEVKGPPPRTYLFKPGFIGREEQFAKMNKYLEQLHEGTGGFLLLQGVSGIGKTRLAVEFGNYANKQDVKVLTSECPYKGVRPLEILRKPLQILADRCRELGLEETEMLFGKRGQILAKYDASISGLPGQDLYTEPVDLPEDSAKLRLFSYLTETLRVFAEKGPFLLILDDLQWTDDLSVAFLEFLVRGQYLDRFPMLIVGIYRKEEANEDLLKALSSQGVSKLDLSCLDEATITKIIEDMLSLSPVPESFGKQLTLHSEGNPYFVSEYLHLVVDEGLLWRDERGNWQIAEEGRTEIGLDLTSLPLPGSLRDLISHRLQSLPKQAQNIAQAAAVIGGEISFRQLRQMSQLEESDFLDATEELVRRHVLEEISLSGFKFAHAKIREVAYEGIDSEELPELHRAAALGMESLYPEIKDDHLAILGFHWENAGQTSKARQYYLQGARKAKEYYAIDEAARLYLAYLNLVDEITVESITTRNEFALNVLQLQCRNQEAINHHEQALQEAIQIGATREKARSLYNLGTAHWQLSQLNRANEYYTMALDVARTLKERVQEGKIFCNLAALKVDQGNFNEAGLLYRKSLAILEEAGDLKEKGRALCNLAILHHNQGNFVEAKALYEQALGILRQAGDKFNEVKTLSNLAVLHNDQGLPDQAHSMYQETLAIFQEMGAKGHEALMLCNIADILHDKGCMDDALNLYQQALVTIRETGDRRLEGICISYMAPIQRRAYGDMKQAENLLLEAEHKLKEVGDNLFLAANIIEQGHVALANEMSAQVFIDQARTLSKQIGVSYESKLGLALRRLLQAQEAFEAKETHRLYRGELLEDIPEKIRCYLIRTGQLPVNSDEHI